MKSIQRVGWLVSALLAAALVAPSSGQPCEDDVTMSVGVEEKKAAKGASLSGALIVEFLGFDSCNGTASDARVTARLRRGSQLEAFFVDTLDVSSSFDDDTPEDTGSAILGQLRGAVLGRFFGDECGASGEFCPDPATCDPDGTNCPSPCLADGSNCTPVGLVFKQIEQTGRADDLIDVVGDGVVDSHYVVSDVVVSLTDSL